MNQANKPGPHGVAEWRSPGFRVIGEKNGPTESGLKQELSDLFCGRIGVERAYLANCEVGDNPAVVLCIKNNGANEKIVAQDVGRIFRKLFATSQYMDILFLSETDEPVLRARCAPFYIRAV